MRALVTWPADTTRRFSDGSIDNFLFFASTAVDDFELACEGANIRRGNKFLFLFDK